MSNLQPSSNASFSTTSFTAATASNTPRRHNTNWHEAAVCAIQIELKDYDHLLEYLTEYPLGKNSFRIDLLLIKKLSEQPIPKNIAKIFKTFNLFEIKGLGSSINTDCYYKTIGYASLLIDQMGRINQYINTDISLSFLCLRYPRRLMNHLKKKRELTVAKSSPGVYYIINEIFIIQIIVTRELSSEDNLYLHCMTGNLNDVKLINRLAEDYKIHQEQEIYVKYMHQLSNANIRSKGESTMVCEGLLNLFGTSEEEIVARTKAREADFYLPKIEALTNENAQQSSFIDELSSQVNYLKNLLTEHNIPFNLES